MSERPLWWHAFGTIVPEGQPEAGEWYLVIAERSDRAPDAYVRELKLGPLDAPYLASWDHEPSQADKDFVTPAHLRRAPKQVETPEVD